MEAKFTKGEWELVKFGDGYGVWSVHEHTCVAEVKTDFSSEAYQEEMTANVHLMKTSPKMYKMLESLSELMPFLDEQTHPQIECDALKYGIDSLLAEARGETL